MFIDEIGGDGTDEASNPSITDRLLFVSAMK